MTLDDALSCGRIIKVVVKESYNTSEEANSTQDVRYGMRLSFKNLDNSHLSDVGMILENKRRKQFITLETSEDAAGDVGATMRWVGVDNNNQVHLEKLVQITTAGSVKGFSCRLGDSFKTERGRSLDILRESDKTIVGELTAQRANEITLNLKPKIFTDPKEPTEELVGIFEDGVDPLITSLGGGISPNSIIAALVKTVQELKEKMSQLFAHRDTETSTIREIVVPVITTIGMSNETSTIEEVVVDIKTVGTVQSTTEDATIEEVVVVKIEQ
jgi:hypothetical protein